MPWHPGERAVQERAGVTANADAIGELGSTIPPAAADFLNVQPWLVIAAADGDGHMWVSPLHGAPGFLEPRDERTVRVGARPLPGDPLADVLLGETQIGAIAIEPSTRRRMRLNGTSRPDGDGLLISTEQVYANCPKYISARSPEPAEAPSATAARSGGLNDEQGALLAQTDTFFVGTRAPRHGADASHRGGNPGFVVVREKQRLTWPDYRGNSMFNTFGNLELDPAAGLLVVDFEGGDLLQLTGHASVVWDAARIAAFPRAERLVDFTIDEVVHRRAAAPLRWRLESRSKVSPPPPVAVA